ncbi:cutinase family protein [Nocardia abscessus]|uniref:cutinase family protein n=1 Tax=Nocardia abscessus TaxID=120957 RepID=UPI002457ABA7|nr:cutinase family protein [Nocardia abscessus]
MTTAAVMATGAGTAAADESPVPLPGCPTLLALGVQGTSESSLTASPSVDSGMLGQMFASMLAEGADVDRVYIPYPASFGGAMGTGPGTDPFVSSTNLARARLDATAAQVVAQCPHTKIAAAGFSGGAAVVSGFAQDVGAGIGPVPADRVVAIALLSDPTRPAGAGPIPGRPGQVSPSAPPGTEGTNTAQVRLSPVPGSGGIADGGTDFGSLSGRVGEFCAAGDLACDAPGHAAALRTAAGLAAQADLRDPITAAGSLAGAWGQTASEASTTVVLSDVTVDAAGQVNYTPAQTVSQRLAEAADPRTPAATPEQTQAAAEKVGQVVGAIAADPLGQIPRLANQIGAAIGAEIAANADLLNPATLLHYATVTVAHTGYGANGQTGEAADWFAAVSHDLSGNGQ